jgi:ParB family transcriptional regulator, chromosome partitioning protein
MSKELNQSQRKALGKGLSALLPTRGSAAASAEHKAPPAPAPTPKLVLPERFESFESIPLDQITPSEAQPRTTWDAERLEELAQSIREHGVIQPVTVCKTGPQKFSLVAGERRWRASKLAGLKEIPALVRTVEQNRLLELALIENIQREDLNPIETAIAFSRLIEQHKLTHDQVAERTGKDRSTVTNFLRLLKLAPEIQNDLVQGDITMGHARALLGLSSPELQRKACQSVLDHGLSVRATERLVKELSQANGARPPATTARNAPEDAIDPNIRAAVDELQSALGTRVRLHPNGKGGGKIEIEYYSQDDLDRIYSILVK